MAELHLVGTLTQDPDGAARLAAVLEAVQPDVVAVEASWAGFEHQRSHGDAASAAALAAITARGVDAATSAFWRRWLAKEHLHFEVFTAAAFAAARGLPLHFLDAGGAGDAGGGGTTASPPDDAEDSAADADGAAAYRLADAQTLTALAAHDWAAAYAADYARARVDLEAKACLEFLLPVAQQRAYYQRDHRMARQIAALLTAGRSGAAGNAGNRVAVVCALTHLYFSEARLTIYSQLYDQTTHRHITDGAADAGAIRDYAIVLPWLPH